MPDVVRMSMAADILLGLEHRDFMLLVQMMGNRVARNAATDNGDFQSGSLSNQ